MPGFNKLSRRLYSSSILIFYLILIAYAIWDYSRFSWASKQLSSQDAVQIVNETRLLEVAKAEPKADSINLVLKNNHTKYITGFQIRIGQVTVQSEFIGSDEVFPPGTVYEKQYPVEEKSSRASITVLAVIFEDGSSDGNPQYIKQIKDKRLGEKTQIKRAIPLLQKGSEASEGDPAEALRQLRADISSLAVKDKEYLSDDYALGLHDRKALLLRQLERLQHKQQTSKEINVREELGRIKGSHEKALAKL